MRCCVTGCGRGSTELHVDLSRSVIIDPFSGDPDNESAETNEEYLARHPVRSFINSIATLQGELDDSIYQNACEEKGNVELAKLLLQNSADPNTDDEEGVPLLYKACEQKDWDLVTLLLQHGADPEPALWQAAEADNLSVARFLAEHGSALGGVVINPYDGRSARDVAKSSAKHDVRDFFRNLGCFLGRYELEGEALHRSETSVLRYATDISTFPNQPVALKFMQDGEALRSEIEMRVPLSSTTSAEPKCVVSMTAYHVPEGFEGFGGMVGSGGVDDGEDSHLLQPERKPRAPDQDLTEPGFGFVMVMDRMDQSLHHRLGTQRIAGYNVDEAIRIFKGLVSQVGQLHQSGVQHFDLKPRNILLHYNEVMLCDLDASMLLYSQEENGRSAAAMRSRSGKQGSSGYYAPEVARWQEDLSLELNADTAADVWSLGAILFEFCSGRTLFSQDINDDKLTSKKDKCRLTAWIGISDEELDEVFPQEQGATREAAQALIRWCLMGCAEERPTITEILHHRFLDTQGELQPLGKAICPVPNGLPSGTFIYEQDHMRMQYHVMITHFQAEAAGDTGTLAAALRNAGMHVWRDVDMQNLTLSGMCQGVMDSDILVVLLTNQILSRWYCLMEIQYALEFGKQIVFVQETEGRFWEWDYARWTYERMSRDPNTGTWEASSNLGVDFAQCEKDFPDVVAEVKRQHELSLMIPYRRRDFECDGMMVPEIMRRAASASVPTSVKNPDPRPQRWAQGVQEWQSTSMPGTAGMRGFIIFNTESGEGIKLAMEAVLEGQCESVSSSSDSDPEALIDDATHFIVALTKDSVTPGQASLRHLERALTRKLPLELIFRPPFFEEDKCKAPPHVKELLNNREALQYRDLAYERDVLVTEVVQRLRESSMGTRHVIGLGQPLEGELITTAITTGTFFISNDPQYLKRRFTLNSLVSWMKKQQRWVEQLVLDPLLESALCLNFKGGSMEELPSNFGLLINLETLNLNECRSLRALPEGFGKLSNLQTLDLSGTALVTLPEGFGDLKNLEKLGLGYCDALVSLPEGFGQLEKLHTLSLACCTSLVSLSEGFGDLTNLATLYLDDAPAGRSMPAALKAQLEAQGCESSGNGW